jgi:hypothetical protein
MFVTRARFIAGVGCSGREDKLSPLTLPFEWLDRFSVSVLLLNEPAKGGSRIHDGIFRPDDVSYAAFKFYHLLHWTEGSVAWMRRDATDEQRN